MEKIVELRNSFLIPRSIVMLIGGETVEWEWLNTRQQGRCASLFRLSSIASAISIQHQRAPLSVLHAAIKAPPPDYEKPHTVLTVARPCMCTNRPYVCLASRDRTRAQCVPVLVDVANVLYSPKSERRTTKGRRKRRMSSPLSTTQSVYSIFYSYCI
jgi:hypothetical protein